MTSDTLDHQYRSRSYPKLPDLFERLRAQNGEPRTFDMIEDWLVETVFTPVTRPPNPTHPLSEAQKPVPCTNRAKSPLCPPHPSLPL